MQRTLVLPTTRESLGGFEGPGNPDEIESKALRARVQGCDLDKICYGKSGGIGNQQETCPRANELAKKYCRTAAMLSVEPGDLLNVPQRITHNLKRPMGFLL